WASFKEKSMEKIWLRKNKNPAYLPMELMGLLSGYGEKPNRVIASSLAIIIIYSLLFYHLQSITISPDSMTKYVFWDYVYYSIVTFTTLGYGDIVPKPTVGARLLAGSEAFIGAFMIGLFVFTLSRKYSAR
ncbi:MAG: two pore domain potassium channel family protein, partial [Candidatus Omnitrophica bacterium]|nr:two pore domain potassium channel family protein [Candidatus Omnitrophota bacterium]